MRRNRSPEAHRRAKIPSLVVGEVSPNGFRTVRSYRLGDSMTWAHPAIVGDRVIIKDAGWIAAFAPRRAGLDD